MNNTFSTTATHFETKTGDKIITPFGPSIFQTEIDPNFSKTLIQEGRKLTIEDNDWNKKLAGHLKHGRSFHYEKEIINEKSDEGKTIIFSTHQMEQVEKLCDNICLINNGKIILNGNLEEIRSNQHNDQLMVKYGGHLEESEIIKFFQNFEKRPGSISGGQ